ncbi:MAG: hypothetical protein Kow0010_04770 [Dehalococcoidia bacterium]
MNPSQLIVNVTSQDPERLKLFYQDVVGLPPEPNSGGFDAGGALFFVDGHSEITGPTKEPARVLVSFVVEDIAAEERRLVAAGVPCIRSQGKEFWGGVISTFVDPDGNYFQAIEYQPA